MLPFIAVLLIVTAVCEFVPAARSRAGGAGAGGARRRCGDLDPDLYLTSARKARAKIIRRSARAALACARAGDVFAYSRPAVIVRTVLRGRTITVFETVQTMIAFLLAAVSLADFGPVQAARSFLGLFAWCCRRRVMRRRSRVFARRAGTAECSGVCSAGARRCFWPGAFCACRHLAMVLSLGAGAIAATFVGRQKSWLALEFYGIVFLAGRGGGSGLLSFVAVRWPGTRPGAPGMGVWLAAIGAVLCYAAAKRREGERGRAQALASCVCRASWRLAAVALLVQGLIALIALKVIPGAHHLAFIRTLTLCAAALALVFSGARWRRWS